MPRVAVGFGSNVGDRRAHLDGGLGALSARWKPVARSAIYETAPIGPVDQQAFLNAVAVFETDDEPTVVLSRLLAAEQTRGRTRDVRWGPRTLDLDLLLYESRTVDLPGLTVPHPALTDRRFVLEPLVDAWPAVSLPDGTDVASFLPLVSDQDVRRIGPWGIPRWRQLQWALQRRVRRSG